MIIDFRMLALALAILTSLPVAAQTQNHSSKQAASTTQRADQAKHRCRLNRGVDCDTPDGLNEWLLLERSRKEAVLEGSRHPAPAQTRPAPSGR